MGADLTIITAVAADMADHLAETAASVLATRQLLSLAGHSCSWVVCVDGADVLDPAATSTADVVVTLGARLGVSVARTVAAANASDGWLLPLDGDDILVPDGVLALAGVLSTLPGSIAWVASNRTTLDGAKTRSWIVNERRFEPGDVNREYSHPFFFHPNNVAYRADAVFEAGGWPATPGGEDLALLLRVAKEHPGLMVPPVTVAYRVWEHQTTAPGSPFKTLRPERHRLYHRLGLIGGRDPSSVRKSAE